MITSEIEQHCLILLVLVVQQKLFCEDKKIDEIGFDNTWKVMTVEEYDRIQKQSLRNNGADKLSGGRKRVTI